MQLFNLTLFKSAIYSDFPLLERGYQWTALSVYGISPQGRLCYVVAISFVVLGLDRAPIAGCLETAFDVQSRMILNSPSSCLCLLLNHESLAQAVYMASHKDFLDDLYVSRGVVCYFQ